MQVAGGRLIVLGVACGTMGGYPQVGQVISADLDRLGQVRPGDRIRFERVSIEEARAIDAESRTRRARYLSRVRCVLRPWPGDTGASAVHDRIAIDPAED